jgi:hypothetical protein
MMKKEGVIQIAMHEEEKGEAEKNAFSPVFKFFCSVTHLQIFLKFVIGIF